MSVLNKPYFSQKISNCPSCGVRKIKKIGQKADGFKEVIKNKIFVQRPFFVNECQECRILFKSYTLAEKSFRKYYSVVNFEKWESDKFYPPEKEVIKILKKMPKKSKILDYGCSTGRLLSAVSNYHCVFGFEPNKISAKKAKTKGIQILSEQKIKNRFFDVILLIDVFEHFRYPTKTLKKLFLKIKKNGILIIVTGNGDFPFCRKSPSHFWYFRIIEHICMITHQYANWLEKTQKLKLLTWKTLSHYQVSLFIKIIPFIKEWAFWVFKGNNLFFKNILKVLPGVKKASIWKTPPAYAFRRDHILAVFKVL